MNHFMDHPAPALPSPWLTTWFSPRRTIRRIVDAEAPPGWWPVIALALLGQVFALMQFDTYSQPETEMPLALVPLMLAALVGVFWSIVTQVIMLAEVQRFSILRAIASMVILLIPALLLGLL